MPKIIEFESDPGLEKLQEAVGGYIERVPYFHKYKGRPCDVIVDEEGKVKGKETNSSPPAHGGSTSPGCARRTYYAATSSLFMED